MVVDDAVGDGDPCAPDFVEEALAGEQTAAVADKRRQQLELRGCCFHALAVAAQFKAAQIQLARSETMNLAGAVDGAMLAALRRGTAEKSADAGAEFARAERLGHVLIGARFQAKDLLRLLGLGGEQNDGGLQPAVPQLPTDFKAILVG